MKCLSLGLAMGVLATAEFPQAEPLERFDPCEALSARSGAGVLYWERDWPAMLENPVIPKNGVVRVPELPGFGMQVKPEVWKHPKAVIRTSER